METCEGMLNQVRFHKEETGFLIGMFQCHKDIFSALGTLLQPQVGMTYKLFGSWEDDSRWGRQFKFKNYEVQIPKSTDGIYRYIVNVAKWVGPSIGMKLVQTYGEETLDVLKTDPIRVANDIKGITLSRANEIREDMLKNAAKEGALVELENLVGGLGLKKSLPMELIILWGSDAPDVLKQDPYRLTEVRGIGFPSADMVAMTRFNIDKENETRLAACIKHLLRENEVNGHTWVEETELLDRAKKLLGVSVHLGLARALKTYAVRDGKYIARMETESNEAYIARKIRLMIGLDCNHRDTGGTFEYTGASPVEIRKCKVCGLTEETYVPDVKFPNVLQWRKVEELKTVEHSPRKVQL